MLYRDAPYAEVLASFFYIGHETQSGVKFR